MLRNGPVNASTHMDNNIEKHTAALLKINKDQETFDHLLLVLLVLALVLPLPLVVVLVLLVLLV